MDVDIEKLERLEKAATPGPWETETELLRPCFSLSAVHVPSAVMKAQRRRERAGEVEWQSDDELVIAMRNALPGLLAIAKAAREWLAARDAFDAGPTAHDGTRTRPSWEWVEATCNALTAVLREATSGDVPAPPAEG